MNLEQKGHVIRSVGSCQQRILSDILRLYGIDEITLDFTYSCGNFYKPIKDNGDIIEVPQPLNKMDVYPQTEDTVKIDKLTRIPMDDDSCKCIVYDPPFVIAPNGSESVINPKEGSNIIQKRFASFYPVNELLETYYFHMKEMYRLLEKDGYAIVKCQNTVTSRKQLNSVEYLWFVGESLGFDMVDKFVLTSHNRIISGKHRKQEHSRRFESYFLVFRKSMKHKSKYLTFCSEELRNEIVNGFINNNIIGRKK